MTDWRRFGMDVGSSGYNPAAPSGNFDLAVVGGNPKYHSLGLLASRVLDGIVEAQVLVVGAYAYVVTRGGTFYKLGADDLAIVDSYAIGAASSCTPDISDGVAYFGDDAGYAHAVTLSTMDRLWRQGPEVAAVKTHGIVVSEGGGLFWYGADKMYGRRLSDGGGKVTGPTISTPKGAMAYYDGRVFAASPAGVWGCDAASGVTDRLYPARGQAASVALQTAPWGQTLMAFESEDHWAYAYDLDTGDRVWHDYQTGKLQSPVGMALVAATHATDGYVVIGTRNYSVQPHHGGTGKLQWKHDSFVASDAIVAGFAICAGILGYVYVPTNGRLELTALDGQTGGHGPDWTFGTSTGVNGAASSANKGRICPPTFVNGRVYWGADNSTVYAFA